MGKYIVHRLDANALEIKHALERIGATVDARCPADWLVGYQGLNFILEVKTQAGKQRPTQERFEKGWKGQYAVVRTVEEAFAACRFRLTMAKGKH